MISTRLAFCFVRRHAETLTALEQGFHASRQTFGRASGLSATIPPEEPQVYAMIQRADTIGVLPDRKPGADVDAAAAQARELL